MVTLSKSTSILYFNGMNSVVLAGDEQVAIKELQQKGYIIRHIPIDWQSNDSFETLMEQGLAAIRAERTKHTDILLVGVSAGGTLVVNLMAQLQDTNVAALSICGRHIDRHTAKWDPRTLKRMAFINERRGSQSFYNAVINCQNVAIPSLTAETKKRLLCIRPLLDEVVPQRTMSVEGITTYTIPTIGHHRAIVSSLRKLPDILS